MEVSLLIAPVINVTAMSLKQRREIKSSSPFSLSVFIGNSVDEILYLSFLFTGVTGDQLIGLLSRLQYTVLEKTLTDAGARYDVIVTGSVAEFQKAGISKINRLIKHYKKQV